MVSLSPRKRAFYYPALHKLTYWVTDKAQQTLHNITQDQAINTIREAGLGSREVVQDL